MECYCYEHESRRKIVSARSWIRRGRRKTAEGSCSDQGFDLHYGIEWPSLNARMLPKVADGGYFGSLVKQMGFSRLCCLCPENGLPQLQQRLAIALFDRQENGGDWFV